MGLWKKVGDLGGSLLDLEERIRHPILSARQGSLTVPGTATVVGVASTPGSESDVSATYVTRQCVLMRMDVTREEASTFECGVLQPAASGITRQIEPGLQLAVRCHPSEPKAAADWEATARMHQTTLDWDRQDTNLSWPDEEEWPARGAVEVRHRPADADRIEERRRTWRPETGTIAALGPGKQTWDQGRRQYTVNIDVVGHQLSLLEATPDLVTARLVQLVNGQIVHRTGTPVVVMIDPADSTNAEVDWDATLQLPEYRGLDNIPAQIY